MAASTGDTQCALGKHEQERRWCSPEICQAVQYDRSYWVPVNPPHVLRAKNIRQEIIEKADMGDDEMGGLDIDLDEIVSEAATECETDLSASPDAQQGSRRGVNGIDIAPGGHR